MKGKRGMTDKKGIDNPSFGCDLEKMVFLNIELQKFVQFRYLKSFKTFERIAFNIRCVFNFSLQFFKRFSFQSICNSRYTYKIMFAFRYSGLEELFCLHENQSDITDFVKFFSIKCNGNPCSGLVVPLCIGRWMNGLSKLN
jgi:hypothetical protein